MLIIFSFSVPEALQYIEEKLNVPISRRYYFQVKRLLVEEAERWVIRNFKTKGCYLKFFYNQVDGLKEHQKTMWKLYHDEKISDKDKIDCMVNMYHIVLPRVYALEQQLGADEQGRELLLQRFESRITWTDEERKALEDKEKQRIESIFRSYLFSTDYTYCFIT